jgi:hypothetical protein
MKEETQEAAEDYAEPYRCPATNENEYCKHDIISAFNNGAKWQAERMYSDMQEYAEFCIECDRANLKPIIAKDWFEQFKKK